MLASEPVCGRSRATELPCFNSINVLFVLMLSLFWALQEVVRGCFIIASLTHLAGWCYAIREKLMCQ